MGDYKHAAAYYDLIYQDQKDYAAEAAQIAALIRTSCPEAKTLLDVAWGQANTLGRWLPRVSK
jgi:hypothetical protein